MVENCMLTRLAYPHKGGNNHAGPMFAEHLPDIEYINNIPGLDCLVGDMNIHFDNPLHSLTKQTLTTVNLYNLVQVINKPIHKCGHIIDGVVVVGPDNDIHKNLLIYCILYIKYILYIKSYFNVTVRKHYTTYRTVRNMAKIDSPSFTDEHFNASVFICLKDKPVVRHFVHCTK